MIVGCLPAVGLLAVAFFVAFTHVCVWPTHAHAGASHRHDVAATPDAAATPDGHDESPHHPDGDAVHVASCDAVGTAAVSLHHGPPVSAVGVFGAPLVTELRGAARAPEVRPPGASPPLFLLHAALLI
jgi:hypothetical protein